MDTIALTEADAGELLTLQRAAYATEAQAHGARTSLRWWSRWTMSAGH